MRSSTHLSFSAFILSIILFSYEVKQPLLFYIVFMIGTLLPDIDEKNSAFGYIFRPFSFFFEHRGFLHSVLPAIAIGVLVAIFLNVEIGFAAFFGYLMHLMLDMLNHMGVALFYPFSRFRVKGIIKSGGMFDLLIMLFSIAGFSAIILSSLLRQL